MHYNAQITPGTRGTPVFDTFPKPKNIILSDFSGKFHKEHMSFLVRFFLLAGNYEEDYYDYVS